VTELVVVAAFDIMMVLTPLVEATVVPVGMPVPVRVWPTSTEARLDTPVMDVLPEVMRPVTEPVLLAVAAFDITMVALGAVPLDEATVAPEAMPVPVRARPVVIPLRLDTPVMFKLPEMTMPVNELVLLAVAAADSVMVVPLDDAMVAPEGMPVPEMGCPFTRLAMLDTPVMLLLPVVTRPVIKLLPVPWTVVPVGMPVPVMGCPTMIPAVPLAFAPASATTALPEVTLPVREATKLEAVAGTLIVMVLPLVVELTAVMVVPAG
jgi:hypothetical protein